jgi:hypothetical protein
MAEYIILAHSPSTGLIQRELQLETKAITNPSLAQMFANSFATRLNAVAQDGITDWQPRLDTVDPNFHARTL